MQIKLTIKGQKLTIAQETIAEQTIDYLEAEASFSSEWDNLVKFAHFTKASCSGEEENYIIELVDDKITKDKHLNLSKGEWIVSLHGNEIVGDEVVERATTTIAQLYVKATGNLDGEPLPITPPSVGEQILAKVVEANTRSEEAKQESSQALSNSQEALEEVEDTKESLLNEINRAKSRENEIENKIPSIEGLATKQELIEESNRAKSVEQNLNENKANKSDTYTKQEVDEKIAQATPSDYDQVKAQVETNKTDISTINGKLPTFSLISEAGNKIDLECDTTTYELKAKLYDRNNNLISTSNVIDLPLETLVLNVEYDSTKKAIIITLKDGTTKEVPVIDLVSGLVNEETLNTELAKKQNNIDDLEAIRQGASKGATAVQDTNYVHTDNNFTNQEKTKLASLENYDDSEVKQSIQDLDSSVEELQTEVDGLINDEEVKPDSTWSSQKIADKINDIELAKFPNVTIIGQPTIQQGQISNFSANNYCQFPFVVDFQNQPFQLDFEITTGNEVTQQHNVFDSAFGLAFAVRNSKFVLAISTNGTSWNIGEVLGSHVVLANTTYRIRLVWDKQNLTLEYSTDGGTTYVLDSTRSLIEQPYPKQMFIGITSDKSTFFNGIINLNYATLTIANKIVWQGMDDVGLATRMATDMSNIDSAGEQKVRDIVNVDGKQDKLVSGENIKTINNESILGSGNIQIIGKSPIIKVTSPTSQTITCTNGIEVYSKTGIEVEFEVDYGTWTIQGGNVTRTVLVDAIKTYYVKMQTILGIRRSLTASSPSWERTDNAIGLNATASVGTSAGYSDFDNYYPFNEISRVTLSTGDVMVKIPKFYYRRYRDGAYEYIQIADSEGGNFKLHPTFDRTDGVRNYIYVGAYKTSSNNRSLPLASPQVNQTRATMRENARNKGANWSLIDFSSLSAIQMLMMVEFATNDMQTVIGEGWSASGHSGAIATGSCDTVPNLTGRPAGTSNNVDVVWRGIEGFWGNVWEWVDGLNFNNGAYLICNDISKYADDTATNYKTLSYTGSTGWSGSYIKTMGLDTTEEWAMMPTDASGSSSTYYTDGIWSSTGWRVFQLGSYWGLGLICGLFAANVRNASSSAGANAGSRLLYIPF